jgi:hypothetical protein
MARYRLLIDAEIDGAVLPVGSIVEKPDDWIGPRRAVAVDHGAGPPSRDEPLYVLLAADEHTDEVAVS